MSQAADHESVAALNEARRLFAAEGLPLPYVPAEMQPAVRRIRQWVYGTRPDDMGLYDVRAYGLEAGTTSVSDYVLFGHAGHGVSSYAIHHYLVRGPLALFVQVAWGGAYGDRRRATEAVAARLAKAEALTLAVEAARQRGHFVPGERLFVVAADFFQAAWRRVPGPLPLEEFARPAAWRQGEGETLLQAVLEALDQ